MASYKTRLMQLERELDALDRAKCTPMGINQLDGFLTGIVIHPYLFDEIDWLALVFNVDGEDRRNIFHSEAHGKRIVDRIYVHADAIVDILANSSNRYHPIFDEQAKAGEINWANWIRGFQLIANMHSGAWEIVFDQDANTRIAYHGLNLLAELAGGYSRMKPAGAEALKAGAHLLIPEWVILLNDTKSSIQTKI